jgi:bifunctional non-homologous end joining protein LigD
VLLGVDGGSDFDGLHSRKHDDEVILYAFDVLAADGDDLRKLPLAMRKTKPGCWPTPGMDLRIRF